MPGRSVPALIAEGHPLSPAQEQRLAEVWELAWRQRTALLLMGEGTPAEQAAYLKQLEAHHKFYVSGRGQSSTGGGE